MRLILPLLLPLLALPLTASVFQERTPAQLASEASAVAVLRIDSAGAARTGPGGLPHTFHQAEVLTSRNSLLEPGTRITLREKGGVAAGRGLLVSGTPSYTRGEVVLVFLVENSDGTWRAKHHALGVYHRTGGEWRRRHAVVLGTTDPAALALRDAQVASYVGASSVADWLMTGETGAGSFPVRHDRFAVRDRLSFSVSGNAARVPDARRVIDRAMLAWNMDDPSHVFLWRGDDIAAPYASEDGVNVISLDDPIPDADSSVVGQTFLFYAADPASDAGGSYFPIHEVDIAVRPTPLPNPTIYDELLTHELGHALGFRHSNDGSPASSDAVMNSALSGNFGTSLGSWDRQALSAVYPQLSPTCLSPTVSISANRLEVSEGEDVVVHAATGGAADGNIHWFRGATGDRSAPLGTGATLELLDLRESVRLWALVENECGFARSSSLTIRVQICDAITIFSITPDQSIPAGATVLLDVQHGGSGLFTYTWYAGTVGDVSRPVGTTREMLTPPLTRTSSFWIRITSDCASLDAGPVVVRVPEARSRRRGAHPRG